MAKKHVGIVEQHVEKAVLGVAVLLLLAVVFKYLVGNPNTVAFDGNTQYPGQIDLAVRDKAERLAQKLQRDKEIDADRLTAPSWVDTLKDAFERGPIAVNELTSVITAAVPWGTPVQRIKVEKTRQAREGITLAKVDPSSSPKVRYLRTLAVPPQDPEAKTGDAPTDDKDALEVDVDLVIVRLTFDVARQQEIFLKDYNYEPDFAAVTFADVQVQRQERLGSEWSEWEDVVLFRETPLPSPPVMELVGQENVLSRESRRRFEEYRDKLRSAQLQEEILTPEGPKRGSGGPAYVEEGDKKTTGRRTPPARERTRERRDKTRTERRPVVKGDARDYGTRGRKPKAAAEPEKEKRLRFSSKEEASAYIIEALAKAEAAEKAKKYEDAKTHAQRVLDAHEVSKAGRRSQIRRAEQILGVGEKPERGGAKRTVDATEKAQPLRAFDVSAQPGRTYVYRARVGILNEYCLAIAKLKDPKDATKPVIYGRWSEPSDPVSIERDTYFYLVGRDPRKQVLRVDVFKWYQDGWIRETFTVQPGQEIGGRRDVQVKIAGKPYYEEVDFTTGAVAIDMDLAVPFQDIQSQGKGFGLNERTARTESLIYMDEDGELHQHFAVVDKRDGRYMDLSEETEAPRAAPVKVQRTRDATRRSGTKAKQKTRRTFKKSSRSSRYGMRGSGRSGRGGSRRR